MIDLRSDTVTRPTPAMREAMAGAEVGDDVYGEDPTVNVLQEEAAALLGFEAGLFVPSGSMANLIAITLHARPGQEVIIESRGHSYNYEVGGLSAVAGVVPRPLLAEGGILEPAAVAAAIAPRAYDLSQTGLLVLENSSNLAGGTVYPPGRIQALTALVHERRIPVHLDGARIFNAAAAVGRPAREVVAGVDSMMFCFSKGLCAPVGSMLLGGRAFIRAAWVVRKMLGGGMRQVGVLAAAARVALREQVDALAEDHAKARVLAEGITALDGLELLQPAATNIVIFRVTKTGMSGEDLVDRLAGRNVRCGAVGPDTIRMVTHHDVSRADVETAVAALQQALSN